MSLLAARGLGKSYGARLLLDDVSVAIREGERVGLVGVNGSGKTTLGRVLAGVEPADQGERMLRRGARVLLLEQEPSLDPALTAGETVSLGLREWEAARRRHEEASQALTRGEGDSTALVERQHQAAAEVERLGGWDRDHETESLLGHLGIRDPGASIGTMSGGERRRVALAQLLIGRPDLAVLDEPTNHLDVETIEWLEEYLVDEYPGALLLITHDRYLLDRVATRTLELSRGKVTEYDGGYERYLAGKAEREAHAARAEANRQNFLRRELEWLRRQPKARTTKQKARIERANAALAEGPPAEERRATLAAESERSGRKVLELHGLGLRVGGRELVRGLDLVVTQGERLGIVGRNGAGKTTLLRTLVGQRAPDQGTVELGARTTVAYFDQERSGLDPEKTIFDCVAEGQSRFEVGGQVVDARVWLERFLFDGNDQRKKIAALSGGERARVALARLLRQPANLLVFDEPTNDLDVATLGALEELLVEYGGTALVVTHDRWFLDRVATGILHLDGEGGAVRYAGNHSDFVRARAAGERARAARAAPAPAAVPAPRQRTAASRRSWSRRDEEALTAAVAAVDSADRRVREAEAALADPLLYARGADAIRVARAELEAARGGAEAASARWLELEEQKAGPP